MGKKLLPCAGGEAFTPQSIRGEVGGGQRCLVISVHSENGYQVPTVDCMALFFSLDVRMQYGLLPTLTSEF